MEDKNCFASTKAQKTITGVAQVVVKIPGQQYCLDALHGQVLKSRECNALITLPGEVLSKPN